MSQIPPGIYERIREFIRRGRYGRIELDISDGRVIAVRFIESIKVQDGDCVELREAS